jgi:hypothetical protein
MTRDVIDGSRSQSYHDQQALLEKQVVYEVPHILDAIVCIFIEYVRSGTRLYSNNPRTYTRCQEKYDDNWQLVVGGFGPGGLVVHDDDGGGNDCNGVGGCRKFESLGH